MKTSIPFNLFLLHLAVAYLSTTSTSTCPQGQHEIWMKDGRGWVADCVRCPSQKAGCHSYELRPKTYEACLDKCFEKLFMTTKPLTTISPLPSTTPQPSSSLKIPDSFPTPATTIPTSTLPYHNTTLILVGSLGALGVLLIIAATLVLKCRKKAKKERHEAIVSASTSNSRATENHEYYIDTNEQLNEQELLNVGKTPQDLSKGEY